MTEDGHPRGAELSARVEAMRQVTIGEPVRLDGPVELVEYSAEWPRLFEGEAAKIRSALGSAAVTLEHAGSTSVPGLAAKPILDIAELVRAPLPQGHGSGREPARVHRRLRGDRPNVDLSRLAALPRR